MICVALAGSSLSYCTGSSVMFGCAALIWSWKPLMRASVVEMPGFTLTTIAEPLSPISLASASAAVLPPASLSDEIRDTPTDVSVTVVSTRTTLVPVLCICLRSGVSASVSTGEISRPAGLVAATELMIGRCWETSHCAEPSDWNLTPSFFASACAAQIIVM